MKKPIPENTWPENWKVSYFYDEQEVFNNITIKGFAYAYANRQGHALSLVKQNLLKGAKILDVAAAQGNFSLLLAEAGYDVTWNDLRGDLLEYVKLKYEYGKIDYVVGDVFELGYESTFDAIIITEIIEHVAHPDEFLNKIGKMVKPGGYVIMTTPNGAYMFNRLPRFSDCEDPSQFESIQFKPNSDGHIFLIWPDEVRKLAAGAGLTVIDQRFFTTLLTSGHLKTRIILNILPRSVIMYLEKIAGYFPAALRKKIMIHTAVCFQKSKLFIN